MHECMITLPHIECIRHMHSHTALTDIYVATIGILTVPWFSSYSYLCEMHACMIVQVPVSLNSKNR